MRFTEKIKTLSLFTVAVVALCVTFVLVLIEWSIKGYERDRWYD